MGTTVDITQLRREFGPIVAVDEVSFSVRQGEVLGFLGPNGAGKSTTMKMITGFLTPTRGTVAINGYDIQQQPLEAKRRVGYLPEGAPAYQDMTPTGFLRFIAEMRGLRGEAGRRRVEETIGTVNLGSVIDQPIETLSKGFKRRVGLAQAILHDPKVLILDEPTDGLDPNQKHQVRQLIQALSQDKIVVISTHILEEVSAVCTRAVIISAGRVVADGTPVELEQRSRHHQAVSLVMNAEIDVSSLRGLPGVADVQTDESGQQVTVFPANGQAIFPHVQALVQEKGWQVEAMHVERGRLDEVFREITIGGAQ